MQKLFFQLIKLAFGSFLHHLDMLIAGKETFCEAIVIVSCHISDYSDGLHNGRGETGGASSMATPEMLQPNPGVREVAASFSDIHLHVDLMTRRHNQSRV